MGTGGIERGGNPDSERKFRLLADAAPIGVYQEEVGVGVVYVNQRWQEITGMSSDEALGTGWQRLLHPDDLSGARNQRDRGRLDAPQRRQQELRIVRPDGEVRIVQVGTALVRDPDGDVELVVGTMEDITESKEALGHVTRLSHVIESSTDLVGIYDRGGSIYINDAARRFFGVEAHRIEDLFDHLPGWFVDGWDDLQYIELSERGSWSGEIELQDHKGRVVPMSAVLVTRRDDAGEMVGFSAVLRDLSERKALEERLEHQATHDPLTQLPNRTLLLDRLSQALPASTSSGIPLALLFLDLDRFKVVNDSLGHALGDQVLTTLAERISGVVRSHDTVARFGGDEFVVLVEEVSDEAEVIALAERLADAVAPPVEAGGEQIVVSTSVGIAISSVGDTAETLLRDADAAMYRAKAQGPSRYAVFDAEMRREAVDRLMLESSLRRALDRDELVLHFQPKVHLESGRLIGFEALVRWQHPGRGLLMPAAFLPIAEESGLSVHVGRWVLDRALAALVRLDEAMSPGSPPLYMCVNLSPSELDDPGLVPAMAATVARHGVDPGHVDLELTEHALMRDVKAADAVLRSLKELGLMIAVDDFGTGYSSLAYLRSFPVDLLKIDRTFVAGLGSSPQDAAIVTAVSDLARSLALDVVAEGVETEDQLAALRRIGVSMAQGYHLGRPMPEAEAIALAAADRRW